MYGASQCVQPVRGHDAQRAGRTSNQSCQSRMSASRTRIVAAVRVVLKRKWACSLSTCSGKCFFWMG
jgi:hypothetical protein